MLIGVISDTHGLLRPAAIKLLTGVDLIVHAGDVGKPEVLTDLGRLAPVTAVRGNCDRGRWAERLPPFEVVEAGDILIYVLHDLNELEVAPAIFRVIVSGHSHRPSVRETGGVLYLNPGSAGPKRFDLPVSLAILTVDGWNVRAEIVELAE